ncbi:hypothetical protein B0T17DRAFT_464659, partial [Bombardia bombarda]
DGSYEQFELDDLSRPRPASRTKRTYRQKRRESDGLFTRFLALLRPSPPRSNGINPILPSVQQYPARWLQTILPGKFQRAILLIISLIIWAVAFGVPLVHSKGTVTDAAGQVVTHLDCVDTLWRRNNECGLDGIDCRPFSNESFAFRCPADCAGVRVLNPHHVGPQDVNYRPLVMGGPVYRGDSFVCGAAIHAGVINDAGGGCGRVSLVGEYYGFFSSAHNGIESIAFDSYFPLSFTVSKDDDIHCNGNNSKGPDPRHLLLPISLIFTILLSLLTTSPASLFFPTFVILFAHVALVSDPPAVSGPSDAILPTLFSIFIGRLLPSLFCAAILFSTCVNPTLSKLPSSSSSDNNPSGGFQLEKTILWLLPCWLAALSNTTLAWIPLKQATGRGVVNEYFRFGFIIGKDGRAGDYTEAGTWFGNGTWSRGAGYW